MHTLNTYIYTVIADTFSIYNSRSDCSCVCDSICAKKNSSRDDMVRIIPRLEDKFYTGSDKEEEASTSNPTIILCIPPLPTLA